MNSNYVLPQLKKVLEEMNICYCMAKILGKNTVFKRTYHYKKDDYEIDIVDFVPFDNVEHKNKSIQKFEEITLEELKKYIEINTPKGEKIWLK
ncbi:MAG: hypothetical protein ACLSVP_00690 [Fusobacterium sp.]|uniref:hypothetical protein n=1 Tax=Fusobacterium sp. TaxID=68766 RepID=UPI003996AEB6